MRKCNVEGKKGKERERREEYDEKGKEVKRRGNKCK